MFRQVYPPATAPAPNATAVHELKLIINAIIAPIILIFLIFLTSQSGFYSKIPFCLKTILLHSKFIYSFTKINNFSILVLTFPYPYRNFLTFNFQDSISFFGNYNIFITAACNFCPHLSNPILSKFNLYFLFLIRI